jgi:hypothetical protein
VLAWYNIFRTGTLVKNDVDLLSLGMKMITIEKYCYHFLIIFLVENEIQIDKLGNGNDIGNAGT